VSSLTAVKIQVRILGERFWRNVNVSYSLERSSMDYLITFCRRIRIILTLNATGNSDMDCICWINGFLELKTPGAHLEFWRPRHKKFFAHFYSVFVKINPKNFI
jgi:hypothetical protein